MTEQDLDLDSLEPEAELEPGLELAAGWEDVGPDRVSGCHRMLLRLAGRLPDALLTQCRSWLAVGELSDLAHSVAFWAVSHDATLTEADAALLSSLLTEANVDPSGLTQLNRDDFDPFPYYAFATEIPLELEGGGAAADPAADQAAVRVLAAEPGAIGLWRAWRFPADGAPWPPPRRVFVAEVAAADAAGVAARLQDRVAAAGEADPQVEVYESGFEIPVYQEFARTYGELLWAAAPDPGIQLAAIFDEADAEAGPYFRSTHPVLAAEDAEKVVQYLLGGEPVLVTDDLMDDVLDSTRLLSVPMSFRTDGAWVWNEAAAYYADQYQLEPDPGLLEHVRASDYLPPAVDGVGVHRALQALEKSAGDEVMWMFGSRLDEPDDADEPDYADEDDEDDEDSGADRLTATTP